MIWSVTPFCNELDVLEIRLASLDRVVDRHVLVEATVTQSGDPKPLHFAANDDRFARWREKIAHVVVDDMPSGPHDDWLREHYQRDQCVRGLDDMADSDLVFLSDVDEVPCPDVFGVADPSDGPVWVGMTMHLYYLNWCWPERPVMGGTRATFVTGRMLRESRASVLVEAHSTYLPGVNGWHLAYQGGLRAIQGKLRALADFQSGSEFFDRWRDHWSTDDHLEWCMATGMDLFDRGHRQSEWVPDSELPPYVRENRERFAHMLIPERSVVAA